MVEWACRAIARSLCVYDTRSRGLRCCPPGAAVPGLLHVRVRWNMGPGGARAVSHSGGPAQAFACETAWVCRGAEAACLSSCMLLSRLPATGEGLYGGQGGRQAPPPSPGAGLCPR